MKTNKLLVLSALLISLVGCNFFDTKSVSTMDSREVFSTPAYTEQAIAGVYELFGENNSYRNRLACGYQGLNTDIEHSTKSDGDTKQDEKELMLYNATYANGSVSSTQKSDIWAYLNTGVERCNNIIEGIEANSNYSNPQSEADQVLRYYLGEAYFLRAFITLEMVKYWGDIPTRFVSLTTNPESLNAKKVDRNIAFDQIRSDFKKAAEYMPYSVNIPVPTAKNNVGRASKGAALALLARADLMYAGKAVRPSQIVQGGTASYKVDYNISDPEIRRDLYKEALEACAEIIKNDGKVLDEDFAKPFKQICADEKKYSIMEHMWAIPFADGARGQVLNYNAPKLPSQSTKAGDYCVAGHLHGYSLGGSSSGHITVSPYLVFAYSREDKRRDVTIFQGQWYYDNGSSVVSDSTRAYVFNMDTVTFRLYQKNTSMDQYYLGKYRFEWMADGRSLSTTDDGVDFPIIRYADVLLMFAEASIGGISGDKPANNTGYEGIDMFNKVRTRAGVPTTANMTMDTIKWERAKELCGEYVRKYDLMRWGSLKEDVLAAESFVRTISEAPGRAAKNINDTIYFKYKYDKTLQAFVMDSVYGDAYNELGKPATYNKLTGWVKKSPYESSSKGLLLSESNYKLYTSGHPEYLESRQYWPIFMYYLSSSNGNLWNDYGYPN